jgi:hypothetical protein
LPEGAKAVAAMPHLAAYYDRHVERGAAAGGAIASASLGRAANARSRWREV